MSEHLIQSYKEIKNYWESVNPEKEGWYLDKNLSFNTMLWLIRFIDMSIEEDKLNFSDSEKEYLKNEYKYVSSISKFPAGIVSV
jgi:hypothetical protein